VYVPVYRCRKVEVDPPPRGYNPGGAAASPSHEVKELLDW